MRNKKRIENKGEKKILNNPILKKKHPMKIVLLLISMISIFVIASIVLEKPILQWIYPQKYKAYVEMYATEYGVEEELVYAIMKAESNFDSYATSHSEAYGLMQLLESTAIEMANELGEEDLQKEALYNPQKNVQIGTAYIAKLLNRYDGNKVLALAAYNAGIGNVADWIEEGIIHADGSNPENIPFKETNMYVRKIMRDYQIYQDIYP